MEKVMGRSAYVLQWRELHGAVEPSRIVSGWLAIAYTLARPLVFLRLTPNSLSLLTIVAAAVAARLAPNGFAVAFVILSLVIDGLDGTVAILRNRVTLQGAMIDSVADRVTEALWGVALWRAGAPLWAVVGVWVVALVQEYVRAKLIAFKVVRIGVVTIAERPVRGIFIAFGLLFHFLTTPLAVVLLILQVLSARTVLRYAFASLHTSSLPQNLLSGPNLLTDDSGTDSDHR